MLCPHCGHDNVSGRRFCRSCARPLTAESVPIKLPSPAQPATPTPTPSSAPAVNKMAIGSLVLSFVAFLVPLGIASVVMGHISRRQIAKSGGRQTGNWFAFAGLILSYLQLAVMAVLALAVVGLVLQTNQELSRKPYVRAALIERLMNGDPSHPSAAAAAEYRRNALDALNLVRAREDSSKQASPGAYACNMYDLTNADPELNQHVIQSHYQFQIVCQPNLQTGVVQGYSLSAVAHFDGDPADRPAYCLDSTGMIRKYGVGEASDGMVNRIFWARGPCPDDGEPIE